MAGDPQMLPRPGTGGVDVDHGDARCMVMVMLDVSA
jgi:hypothetical protein